MITSFLKNYVFLAVLGFCCSAWVFFIVAASGGFSLAVIRGLLIEVASLVAEHRPVIPT